MPHVVLCDQGASYAIGNAAFHSNQLYMKLSPSIPLLVRLLRDPVAKIRANSSGKVCLVIFNVFAKLVSLP